MAYELEKGDECILSGDFKYEGSQAFKRGEIVRIEDVSPDRLQPGNKYVVRSELLGTPVRLPGMLLKRISCPHCKQRLAQIGPTTFADTCECGWSDIEGAHARSVQRLSDFHENLSKLTSREYFGPDRYGYADADDAPFGVGQRDTFAPGEPRGSDRPAPDTHKYACPKCGMAIIVATECPHCGWRYVSATPDPDKKAARMTRDVVVGGEVAFRAGDWVVVEAEKPDPQRPEYKYVVLSLALKQRFLLSDADLSF